MIGSILDEGGFKTIRCNTVMEAVAYIGRHRPTFALVDLYLLGDQGAHLSNEFIKNHLIPNGIPYGRVTSAPNDLPPDLVGIMAFDKRRLSTEPWLFLEAVKIATDSIST